ncbi:MAG: DUF445 family protein [Christiangramia sp.]|nr:DUF445 family protein [Christiangramia sp.]
MVKILQAFSGYLKIFFRYLLIPVLAAVYFLKLSHPGEEMYEIIYILSISALVGYWTNYFAIKMLFKPKEKTLLGFQGVVPANKNRIALDLGRVVKEKFFHTEDIIAYIEEKELIKKFFGKTKDIVDEKLKDRGIKKKIIAWINEKFNTYSPKLYIFLAEKSEFLIRRYFSKSFSPEKVIRFLADYLETNIENGTIDLDKLTDSVVNFVKRNIPQIADYLYKVLEKEIEESSFIKKIVLRIGTFIFDVNPETVKDKVKEAVHEKEFREKVYRILVQVTSDLRDYLNREEVSSELSKHIKTLQEFINTTAKDSLVPALLTRINDFLSRDESWEKIENIFDSIIDFSSRELEKITSSKEFSEFVKTKIPDLLEKFDVESLVVERAQKFDTEQVEEVILRVSGDQLSYIEILGGIIGAVAGIAIFDLEIFSLVFASVALVVFFDFTLTRLRKKKTAIS